jgi:hypothetical protein
VESTNLDSHVAIASTPMTWRNESYMPMFTHTPNFTRTSIIFSTDIPCGDNNVDDELSMNVPVFTGFIFTILGLISVKRSVFQPWEVCPKSRGTVRFSRRNRTRAVTELNLVGLNGRVTMTMG